MKSRFLAACALNLIIAVAICTAPSIARKISSVNAAAVEYARVMDDDTFFYADPACTVAKFVLPCGYFLRVISVGEDSVRVRYMDDSGKIPAREGFISLKNYYPFTSTAPEILYPDCKLTLSCDEVLFSDTKVEQPKTVLCADAVCAFYGYLNVNGKSYFCVYADGYVGYVRAAAFKSTVIPAHPLPLKDETDEPEHRSSDGTADSEKQTTPATTNFDGVLKTVIVLAVSLVALSVVYLLFKPARNRKTAFTDRDHDDLM